MNLNNFLFVFFLSLFVQKDSFGGLTNIAVLDLELNGLDSSLSAPLTNKLRTELFNTNTYSILERSRMADILKEQGFQQTGCTNTECAVQIGQLLNVEKMVMGSIDLVGKTYGVQLRIVDVATGKIDIASGEECENCTQDVLYKTTIKDVVFKLVNKPLVPNTNNSSSTFVKKVNNLPKNMAVVNTEYVKFAIDIYEVTQADFVKVMGEKEFQNNGCPNCPADWVTYNEAKKYCATIGKRLPTELEWEIAAKKFPNSSKWDSMTEDDKLLYGWFSNNSHENSHPVGLLKANKFGLYDMLGNVCEWTSEMNKSAMITKGGSWDDSADNVTIEKKEYEKNLNDETQDRGFRCVRDINE